MGKLANLIWSVVCLFLDLEREFSLDNMLGLTEHPARDSIETAYIVIAQTKVPERNEPTNIEIQSAQIQKREQKPVINTKSKSREKSRKLSQEMVSKRPNLALRAS